MENQTSEETQVETPNEPVETKEETTETPKETTEQTSEETVKKETSKTPEATVNYEEKFKASQKEAKRLLEENAKLKEKPKESNPESGEVDVDKILEINTATKGLSPEAITELQLRAKATGKSLTEARKDENFGIWHKAYKAKVELEKTPPPSTEQGGKEKPKTFIDQLKQHKVVSGENWQDAIEAKAKLLAEKGLFKRSRTRQNPTKLSK